MTIADQAINYVLQNETSKEHFQSNDKDDNAGYTKFGISTAFYFGLPIDEPLKQKKLQDWTVDDARGIYKKYIWDKSPCEKIKNNILAIKFFDAIVNMGISTASKLLQRACNSCVSEQDKLKEDGIIGAISLKEINFRPPAALLKNYCHELLNFYHKIVERDPMQKKFINGWTARAEKIPNASKDDQKKTG